MMKSSDGGLQAMAIYAGGFLIFGVITNALTLARSTQRQNALLLAELQVRNRQLEEYAAQVEELAVVEERNRLAREVHDTLGHRLTTAAVQLEGAQRLVPSEPERAAAMIGAGRQQVREALQDLRRTVGRLREPVELEFSLPQALHRLSDSFQKATGLTDTLLDAAKSDDRLIRQSILLALPKVAKIPCGNCEAKLDAAIKAGEGKTTLGDLNLETTMLRNYFAWAGGKTPSAPATPDAPKAPAGDDKKE
jgi:signal transduction histidine kinase